MEPAVRARYTEEVRATVAAAVGVRPEAMRDLGGFESFVHEAEVAGTPRIVKATWGGRRSPEAMGAEIHFVTWLADRGASVARPLPLADGTMQRAVPAADGVFHVTAWAKAPGRIRRREELDPAHFETWGALLGRIHHLTVDYPGPPPPLRRPAWEDEARSLEAHLGDDPRLRDRFRALVAEIAALPREPDSFGPMHTDPHAQNVLWHEGRPLLIDFEDMTDFHFVADLAIVLFYTVLPLETAAQRQARHDAIVGPLWAGYEQEHALPEAARAALPLFLALREQELRAVMLRSLPPSERSEGAARYLEEATRRILDGAPALDLRL